MDPKIMWATQPDEVIPEGPGVTCTQPKYMDAPAHAGCHKQILNCGDAQKCHVFRNANHVLVPHPVVERECARFDNITDNDGWLPEIFYHPLGQNKTL